MMKATKQAAAMNASSQSFIVFQIGCTVQQHLVLQRFQEVLIAEKAYRPYVAISQGVGATTYQLPLDRLRYMQEEVQLPLANQFVVETINQDRHLFQAQSYLFELSLLCLQELLMPHRKFPVL